MTTALAADLHDAEYVVSPADRRRHLRDLAEQVDRFSPFEVRRSLATWAPGLPAAERTATWDALVADVQRLRDLDGLQDRAAYDVAVGVLRADIDCALHRLTGASL